MSSLDLSNFLQKNQLGREYVRQVADYFAPLAREIVNLHQNKNKTIIVNINGAQGSGKSTLSELLVAIFQQQYALCCVTLSLDDFYYTHNERQHLAHTVHPLLATRGVPGTHDIMLAHETLNKLMSHNDAQTIYIPRFNKAVDDRYDKQQWSGVTQKPHIIILEGWCVGASAQSPQQLLQPINALEQNDDSEGIWRHYVNEQLRLQYEPLFSRADCTVMLKAPSFECVFDWRLEQEEKLIDNLNNKNIENTRTMSADDIERFIQHYQRLTQHVLATLPNRAEYVFKMDNKRAIISREKIKNFNNLNINTLIFSDLDGSLLDHHSYSHQAADTTLVYLEQNHIPVIPCSSKTQLEIEKLRCDLNNKHPFIIENGAAVFIPKDYFTAQPKDTIERDGYWVKEFVQPHEYWMSQLDTMRSEFNGSYKSFSNMTIEEIAQVTDLSLEQAGLAAQRQYGEPVLWLGCDKQKHRFINALNNQGVTVLQGGRFLHICGDANKGNALLWLASTYQTLRHNTYRTVAIGDSHNDGEMLEMADDALIIRSPVHGLPSLSRIDGVTISDAFGPEGWAQGINIILNSFYSRAFY